MCSAEPGRARIIEAATSLFSQHGYDATSVRAIGEVAGVSAPLINHHFGSKEGLRHAVDDHVVAAVEAMFVDLDATDPIALTAELRTRMQHEEATFAYLRRSLQDGGRSGADLFDRLVVATEAVLADLEAEGLARPSADPLVRALVVLTLDLGSLVLEPHLQRHLGEPIWGDAPSARWFAGVVEVLTAGLLTAGAPESDPQGA